MIAAVALGVSALAVPAWQWTPQKSGVSARLRGVSAVSETVAWASGSGSTILRTEDGGATWTKLPEPTPDRLDYRDIDAISATTAYALSIGNGAASRIFKTTDAGQTWTEQYRASEEKIFLDAMTFSDADRGIVLGDSIDGRFFFMTTDNGGAHWIAVPVDRLPPAQPNEGFFAASGTNVAVLGDHIWIGTGAAARARVLHSVGSRRHLGDRRDAAGCRPVGRHLSRSPFATLSTASSSAATTRRRAEAVDNCAITSDGGATWTLIRGLAAFDPSSRPCRARRATWIAIGPRGSDVSTDDGRTWAPIDGPGFDTFSFVRGKAIGWASGARGAIAKLRTLN